MGKVDKRQCKSEAMGCQWGYCALSRAVPLVLIGPLRGGIVLYMIGTFAYWGRPDRATNNYSRYVRPRSVALPPLQSASFAVFCVAFIAYYKPPVLPRVHIEV